MCTSAGHTLAARGAAAQEQFCGKITNAVTKLARSPALKRPEAVAYTAVVLTEYGGGVGILFQHVDDDNCTWLTTAALPSEREASTASIYRAVGVATDALGNAAAIAATATSPLADSISKLSTSCVCHAGPAE